MGQMGIAMITSDPSAKNMDVIHFSVNRSFHPTFESNIAIGRFRWTNNNHNSLYKNINYMIDWYCFLVITEIDQAFAGGFMYGLSMDYPMNLSIALGINVG